MSKMRTLVVSAPPHIYGRDSIEKRMLDVIIALLPVSLVSLYFYRIDAFFVISVSILSAMLAEFLYQKVAGKPVTISDLSAVITGLLIALNLPPGVPLWLPIIGSFFAIIAVKQLFGGLGANFMNPALAARAFLLAAFPAHMTTWTFAPDAVTEATYLAILAENPYFIPETADYMSLLFGKVGGSIGEVSAVALLIGGLYLLIRKVINWRIPVFYIGSFAVFAFIFGREGLFTGGHLLLFEMLSGGLILGAFFMATDYATTPISPIGKIVMGIGCGFLTVMIRFFGGYPEGVSYAILIMNIFVPTIDKYIKPNVYGRVRRKKA
ncbi:MAG: RnfABCDGE type electron transport complex subunit D [Defluviitaleaceae bacterium]|nr:RnfABCDGE type electron transport complex subunit D [Defluviitaleaceae bacterium]